MNFISICEHKTEEFENINGDSNLENSDPLNELELKVKSKRKRRKRSLQPRTRRMKRQNKVTRFYRESILRDFKCPFCKGTLMSMNSLNSHIKDSHGGKKLECAICDMTFTKIWELTDHIDCVHKEIRPYECSECCANFHEK